MWTELQAELQRQGWQARLVPTAHLPELRREIAARLDGGELSGEFHAERLSWFRYQPDAFEEARSIIVLAIPRQQGRITFRHDGRAYTATIPPTYAQETETTMHACAWLTEHLASGGFRATPTRLPLKLLAARSGLAEYGRNNITYVGGLGSFHQLAGFYTDLPAETDPWRPAQVMEACSSCHLCAWSCPSGAILEDRFLLDAERCLVYLNERIEPFPRWLKPEWHTCPIGCMECQSCCPEDQDATNRVEELGEFTEAETGLLLRAAPLEEPEPELERKLRRAGLFDYREVLGRNLEALFESQRRRGLA